MDNNVHAADAPLSQEDQAAVAALEEQIDGPLPEDPPEPLAPTPEFDAAEKLKQEAADTDKAPPTDELNKPSPEELASKMGWAPKEEWRGDPDMWIDAETFLDRGTPAMLYERISKMDADHKRTVAAMERMNKRALDQQKADLKAERDHLVEKYVAAGNAEAVRQVNENYDRLSGELNTESKPTKPQLHPTAQGWLDAKPVFKTNPVFRATADAELTQIEQSMPNASIDEHFAELDKRLSTRFPEVYGQQAQAQTSNAPPAGSRQMDGVKVSTKKATNYTSRLPSEAKAQGQRFVEEGLFKNLEEYAKEYVNG